MQTFSAVPIGTYFPGHLFPNTKVLSYYQLSLRDQRKDRQGKGKA